MTRMIDPDDLVGAHEIASFFEVAIGTVYGWANRHDFPAPVKAFGKKYRIWLMPQVCGWFEALPRPIEPEHGTWQCFRRGCRCEACREAWAAYMRAYRQRRRPERLPSLTPVGADEEVG